MNQLLLRELRSSANASASSPVDFGGLFIGMSFFLILAALGLVGMLFQFVLLQRNREDALLAAVGITPTRLRRWRMGEGLALLLLAAAFAVPLAALYSRGVLHFLETIWSDGAGGTTFTFDASPGSVAGGLLGFLLCSMIAIWFALRRLAKRALSIRLAAHTEDGTPLPRIRRRSAITATVAALVAIGALLSANRGIPAQGAFYLAGFALLGAGLALCRWWMGRDAAPPGGAPAASDLGLLNLKSRRSRSLTVVGLIATAVFMVLSVASFRKHVGGDWLQKRSGTGGFTFWIETTAPQNLSRDGRTQGFDFLDRQRSQLSEILPLRTGTGDNANCFNLNTTAQPQLLAVNAARLATRQAFAPKAPQRAGWSSLAERATANPETRGTPSLAGTNAIPALVDETTLLWALKRKVGDVLEYNDENGRAFQVQIVGTLPDSIFQGYAIVDEQRFLEKFPSHAGYTVFLADANNAATTDLSTLRRGLESATRDIGGRVELTREVLAAFHAIENTYIAIFNVLGSLGVLLGSLGLAIVIARNLRERRGEFAVMSAIGIPRAVLARVVFTEFSRLVLWGLAIGFGAALVAVLPNITAVPPVATIGLAAVLLCGIVLLNLSCGWMVFRWATRDLRPSMLQVA